MCSQPFRRKYSYFGKMCNFTCAEGSNCCSELSLGVDPGTLIAMNLSLPFATLETMYNQTRAFKQQPNASRIAYDFLPATNKMC